MWVANGLVTALSSQQPQCLPFWVGTASSGLFEEPIEVVGRGGEMFLQKSGIFRHALTCIAALLGCQTVLFAEPLWEWSNPQPQGHNLFSAAAGEDVIVAVGDGGTILVSQDGTKWEVRSSATDYQLSDVIWANGKFVAVGGAYGFEFRPLLGVVLTSDDGYRWVERHRVDYFRISSVVWDGSRFVAFGKGAKVLISPDGVTWSEETIELDIWDIEDVVWDGSRFVAVGQAYGEWSSYFTSQDALNWDETPFECECDPAAISWGNGLYIVVGGSWGRKATVLVSSDAETWQEQTWEQTPSLSNVFHHTAGFTAVGYSGVVATSSDGQEWLFLDPQTEKALLGITASESGYLVVGEDGFMMAGEEVGELEVLLSDSLELLGSYEIVELATDGDVTVGVGTLGVTIRSFRGSPWERRPFWSLGYYNSVRWIESEFWAVGDHGLVRSPDGLEWDLMLYDPDILLFDIAWNGSVFVAVGRSWVVGDNRAVVATSANGIEWSNEWIDTGGAVLFAARWAGSRFVAVGASGIHLTSPDGFNWTQHLLDEQITLRDMEWNGDRLVAVGQHWENGRIILSSADGVAWEECLLPDVHGPTFSDVAWTGARFLAVGRPLGDTVFSSRDGVEWSADSTGTGLPLASVGGSERLLYATGLGGKIIGRIQYPPMPRRPGRRVLPSQGNKGRIPKVVR